jgi:hypothetical protein
LIVGHLGKPKKLWVKIGVAMAIVTRKQGGIANQDQHKISSLYVGMLAS